MTRSLLLGAALAALSSTSSLAGGLAPAIVEPTAVAPSALAPGASAPLVLGRATVPADAASKLCPVIPAAADALARQGVAVAGIAVSGGLATFDTSAGPVAYACVPAVGDADADGLPDAQDPDLGGDLGTGGVGPQPSLPGEPVPVVSGPGVTPVTPTQPAAGDPEVRPGGPQGNNGCGNGDQDPPGNSADRNNAENADGADSVGGNCPDRSFDRSPGYDR